MMAKVNRRYLWMSLTLVLSLGTGVGRAADSGTEPNDAFDPNAVFNRIISAGAAQTRDTEGAFANQMTQRLWRSRVSAPGQDSEAQTRAELSEAISRIKSIRFEVKRQEPAATAAFLMPQAVEPQPEPGPAEPTPPVATAAPAPGAGLTSETTDALKRVLADPNEASQPLDLAELLYLTGRLNEAAVLYQKALDSMVANDPASREDRAWAILQIGNCLRETNPTKARDMYTKLVSEYPDSPWVELAKAHSQLISWYEQEQPRQWLAGQTTTPTRQVAASQRP